jgi:hypothetical protein
VSAPALSIPIKAEGVDQFRSQMTSIGKSASDAVNSVESAFSHLQPGLAGLIGFGTAVGGSIAAVMGLQSALKGVASELAAIGEAAKYLNTTTDNVQKLQFAGTSQGIASDQALSNLENVGRLLNDAKTNENSLTKLLEANNVAYKDRTGDLISINQLMAKGADLVKNAGSYADKVEIAKMLGLTQQWVPALEHGAQGFQRIADSATDAGAIIDKETIAKAQVFDAAWKQSSQRLSTELKSATMDAATYLDDLISKAGDFISKLNAANGAAGSGQAKFNALADAAEVAARDMAGLPQDLDQINRVLDNLKQKGADPGIIAGIEELRQKAESAADALKEAAQAQSKLNYPDGVPLPQARPVSADRNDNPTKLPGRSDGDDKVDSATNSLRRHTEQTEADAKAVGLGAGALAQFRAEAAETAAVQANGGKETADQAAQFKKLEQEAGAAADALEKAKVASDINFGKKTAFLSDEDVQVASKLRGIYGDDVPAALNSTEAAAIKTNTALKGISSTMESSVTSGLADILDGTKSVGQGFSDMSRTIIRAIEEAAIKMAIVQPLMASFGGLFGTGAVSAAAKSPFPGFAKGTPSAPGGIALVGEEGPELVNLPKGAAVYPSHTTRALLRDVPAFADGGIMGSPGAAAPLIGHSSVIAPSINVSVQGSPGMSSADHARMGETIASQIKPAIQDLIGQELRRQSRPGGMLRR